MYTVETLYSGHPCSRIECVGFFYSLMCLHTLFSSGIPGAPENLTTREQELDRVELEWDSPQLRMNEVVTYILSATNSDTGDVALNETVVMGTSYTFQRPAGDDLCDAYGFDLFAVNQVGASDAGVSTMSTIPTGEWRQLLP